MRTLIVNVAAEDRYLIIAYVAEQSEEISFIWNSEMGDMPLSGSPMPPSRCSITRQEFPL